MVDPTPVIGDNSPAKVCPDINITVSEKCAELAIRVIEQAGFCESGVMQPLTHSIDLHCEFRVAGGLADCSEQDRRKRDMVASRHTGPSVAKEPQRTPQK
ncbi:MAG: hypothetical protein KYX69_11960 [Sphingomonas sp.]|uniref:hypothetical protein n=1 Tax=Sphingomonas sp. TaxID=28214 RepID=UPI0026155845|nr:hypothetical protein [Sphingomonas sp.]MDK2768422.1 hypothetical protein [Sphingomonas sp.]